MALDYVVLKIRIIGFGKIFKTYGYMNTCEGHVYIDLPSLSNIIDSTAVCDIIVEIFYDICIEYRRLQ